MRPSDTSRVFRLLLPVTCEPAVVQASCSEKILYLVSQISGDLCPMGETYESGKSSCPNFPTSIWLQNTLTSIIGGQDEIHPSRQS